MDKVLPGQEWLENENSEVKCIQKKKTTYLFPENIAKVSKYENHI